MKRYLSAFLAIVMLLSLFTGALSEEAIEALTAEGEAALVVVAADAASDEDEVIAAGDEDQAVGEVGEMELPSDDGADDTAAVPAAGEDDGLGIISEEPAEAPADEAGEAPTDDADGEPADDAGEEPTDEAGEEPTDDAEDPDFMGLFASSNEGEEYFDNTSEHPETVFPERIDIELERNGKIYRVPNGDPCNVLDTDRLQFYADVFPRNAKNPGILWSAETEWSDNQDIDGFYVPDAEVSISSSGLLVASNIYRATNVVVTASTASYSDGSQYIPDAFCLLTPVDFYIDGDADFFDLAGSPLTSIVGRSVTDGKETYQIVEDEEDPSSYGAINVWIGKELKAFSISYMDDIGLYFDKGSEKHADLSFTIYPHATGVRIYRIGEDGDEAEVDPTERVVLGSDEAGSFRVELLSEGVIAGMPFTDVAMPGFSVEDVNDTGYNDLAINDDETPSFTLSPGSAGDSVYRITSADGRVSTTLRVYRKPETPITDIGLAEGITNVELGLKQTIDLSNYEVGDKQVQDLFKKIDLFRVEPEGAKYDLIFTTRATKIIGLTEDGKVTGKKKGTATVTATVKGHPELRQDLTVVVKEKAVSKVSITGKKFIIGGKGATTQLKVSVAPAQGKASKRVYWFSSKPNIATVDQTGLVTVKGYYDVSIFAYSMDGTNRWAEFKLGCCDPVADIQPKLYADMPSADMYYEPCHKNTNGEFVIGVKARALLSSFPDISFQSDVTGEIVYSGHYRKVSYKMDKKYAKIIGLSRDSDGDTIITGKKAGTATVLAYSEDGINGPWPFKVKVVKPGKVNVSLKDPNDFTFTDPVFNFEGVGEYSGRYRLNASESNNAVGGDVLNVISTNENVAYAEQDEEDGRWYLYFQDDDDQEAGTATLTVYMRDFVSTGSIKVTVYHPIEGLRFEDEDKYILGGDGPFPDRIYEVAKGKSIRLPMPVFEPSTSEMDLIWESGNKAIATVSNGVVKGVKPGGPVKITARSKANNEISDYLWVTVLPKAVSKITMAPVESSGYEKFDTAPANRYFFLFKDGMDDPSIQMRAQVDPGDASRLVEWSAENEEEWGVNISDTGLLEPRLYVQSVVEICDDYGETIGWDYVEAARPSTITVTAAATDGSGRKGTAVLVFDDYVKGIQLYGNSPDGREIWLAKGDKFDMSGVEPGRDDTPRVYLRRASSGDGFVADDKYASSDDAAWSVTSKAGKKIVSVDKHGSIYGKKAGTAVVRIADKLTGVHQDITVRVYDKPTAVNVKGADNGILRLHSEGDTATLTAVVTGKKKQKVPGGVFWFAEGDGVEANLNTGIVTATRDLADATVYAVPRMYDLSEYGSGNTDGFDIPRNAVVGKVKVCVTPDVDEVRVFGPHSVAVGRAIKVVGRTYTEGDLAEDQRIVWSVKPGYESKVSVDPKTGAVKGVEAGRAYIRATAVGVRSGKTAPVCQYYVDVTEPIKSIRILADYLYHGKVLLSSRDANAFAQLSVQCDPFNANPEIKWTSANTKIVTVDANGVVRVSPKLKMKNSEISVTITATAVDSTRKDKAIARITVVVYDGGE